MVHFTLSDLPLDPRRFTLARRPVGLVIVDEVNGFATPGQGPLAPPRTGCEHRPDDR